MRSLTRHVSLHGFDGATYRARFGLEPTTPIENRRPKRARADDPDYWQPILGAAGFSSFDKAVAATVAAGGTAKELAAELDVPYSQLTTALRSAGASFPSKTDRMLVLARKEMAAGRNLSAPSNRELKRWLYSQRNAVAQGTPPACVPRLAELDPDWMLSEQARCARDGVPYVSPSTRGADKRWEAGLKRGGFANTEEAIAWMRSIGGGPPALQIRMEMPQMQVWSKLTREGHEWPRAENSGASFERQLTAAVALAKRDGDLGRAPDVLRVWLRERVTMETEPWVNAMLDEADPNWRLR